MLGSRTGIGNYAYNLCQRLVKDGHVENLDLLVHGALLSFDEFLQADRSHESSATSSAMAKLRGTLARFPPAVWTYKRLMPLQERWVLRNQPDSCLFHSPNYFMPAFSGRNIVTIPDLSTWLHPEWHPKASADLINHHIEQARKRADHIITISQRVKHEIVNHLHVAEDRITVTHLGASEEFRPVSAEEFQTATDATGLRYKDYFLFMATIEPRKNLGRLLEAYLNYRQNAASDALPLVVCGHNGWKSDSVHRRLRELHAEGVVHYLGYTPSALARQLLAGARALAYPSLYEGFGLPVLEAMQSGTAVITSDNNAAAEVSGQAALLIDPESSGQLEAALHQLHQDPGKLSELETAGMARARTFSWERCARETTSIYEEVSGRV